jgi:hypothetical protein
MILMLLSLNKSFVVERAAPGNFIELLAGSLLA